MTAMSAPEIVLDQDRIDVDAAHAFLTTCYWSPGIPREVVARAIANSLCVAARVNDVQVGFARLVTDRATFAYLADVHVLEPHRGQGIAGDMLRALFAHPDVQGLRRKMLLTRDAHGLYRHFGFQASHTPERIMEQLTPNVYAAHGLAGASAQPN